MLRGYFLLQDGLLNSNGAAKSNDNKAGCGGVLRNERDMWLDGFAKALGDTTAYMAELWVIYERLKLAKQRVVKLEVRTYSQVIAQSLHERKNGSRWGAPSRNKLEDYWKVHGRFTMSMYSGKPIDVTIC
jgi:ribonuclease HI